MKRNIQFFTHVVPLLLVVALLLTFAAPAFAEGGPGKLPKGAKTIPLSEVMKEWKDVPPSIGVNGGMDPNYLFSVNELQEMHEKTLRAKQYYESRHISPNYLGSKTLSVGYYPEPDDDDHVNYCGPAATLVALSARQPTSASLLENVANEEWIHKPDPPNSCAPGVCMWKVRDVLNNRLNTTHYVRDSAQDANEFYSWVVTDIDHGYVLVTGVLTTYMPGWHVTAPHIVAVHGYWEASGDHQSVKYIETSSPHAGYNGPYYQSEERNRFFDVFVRDNNAQAK
ncbi:MAG: hypothetical protein DSY55_05165 [Clostridia bacterium]|nr:MAG: hypothetical protein DSY55_05165 [Clostridia bacterium]